MPAPIIVRNPELKLTYGSTVVDLSAHCRGATPSDEPEIKDNRTFAEPTRQDFGNRTVGMTINLGWSPDLYDALAPYIGVEGQMAFKPVTPSTKAIRATVVFGALPWGAFTLGEASDVDLPLIVRGDITHS